MPMDEGTKQSIRDLMESRRRKSKPPSSRKSPTAISIDPNVRCHRIYPVEDSRKTLSELKTIGITLSRQQAIDQARVLLAVTQEWDRVDLIAYRKSKRQSDGTYPITVTSVRPVDE